MSAFSPQNPFVFVGTEALARPEILPDILRSCRDRRLMPILVTRGHAVDEDSGTPFDPGALFDFLRHVGPYKLVLALDDRHYAQMGPERFSSALKAVREGAGIPPDVLYLVSPGRCLPTSLLEDDEVNRLATLRPRVAQNLLEFLTRLCSESATVDLTRGGPSRLGSHAQPRGGDLLAAPPPVGTHGYFADGTPRAADESQCNPYVLSFNALLFETTYFCNARCTHCYTSSGPDSPRSRLAVADVCRVIDEAAALPNIRKRCSLAGGEATIFWKDVIDILRHSSSRGYDNSLTTNGWWGDTPRHAVDRIAQLADVGVTEIEFSVDAMHQAFIRPAAVANIIRAAKQADITILLRVCTTQRHRAAKVLDLLPAEEQSGISIAVSATLPIGRAKNEIPLEEIWLAERGFPSGACHDALNLVVTPTGDVFPCCAGSELCPSLSVGNVFRQSLEEIMLELRGNLLLRTLVHAGPAYLAGVLGEAGLGHKLRGQYSSYCDLCNEIFTDPELAAHMRQAVEGVARTG
jgi:organic radical activating enzyme